MSGHFYATRYWLPDGDPLEFSDRGFMPDPSRKWSGSRLTDS